MKAWYWVKLVLEVQLAIFEAGTWTFKCLATVFEQCAELCMHMHQTAGLTAAKDAT